MDTAATLDLVNELEAAAPVEEWRVGSVPVWPLVRERIVWHANADNAVQRSRTLSDDLVRRRARRLARLGSDLAGYTRGRIADRQGAAGLHQPADLLILGDNVSRVPLDGRWYDRLCDPVVELAAELGLSSLQLDPHHLYRVPRAAPSAWIQPQLDALLVAGRLSRARAPEPELPGRDELARLLKGRGVTTTPMSTDAIRSGARQMRLIGDFFGKIVERSGARTGVLVDFSVISMGFNLACREQGIPSIELQHGVQGAAHWAYARWDAVPSDGFSVLPSIYWNWTESDAQVINAWAGRTNGHHRAVAAGNLWIRSWLSADSPLVADYDARAQEALPAGSPLVLWTLQPGISGPHELGLLLQAAELAPGWIWLPRLHPAMTVSERSTINQALAQLPTPAAARVAADDLPLPALLRRIDAHVTFSSSTTLEAATFGVPTVLTSAEGALYFEDLIAQRWARPAAIGSPPTAPDVVKALEAAMATRDQTPVQTAAGAADILQRIVGRSVEANGSKDLAG